MNRPTVLLWQWGRRGGGPRFTLELARALALRDDVRVCLSVSKQAEIHTEFTELPVHRYDVDTYSSPMSALTSLTRLLSVRRNFWRFAAQEKVDLVIGTMSHLWNVPMLMWHAKRPPFLMVLHDAAPHPGEDVPLRHWLLRQEVAQSCGVVTLTRHVQDRLCAEEGYPRERTSIIPLGIFPYASPDQPRAGGPLRLLFFGRIMPYKGLDLLLEAMALLQSQGVEVDLTVAGPGNLKPHAGALAALKRVTLENRWIAESEIGPIFQQADVCVLPYREASQSGVIATAFATGVPVVGTPIGGLVEQIQHEQNGLICPDVTASSLAAAITRLADDRQLLSRCARGAAHTAQTELAWPAIAERYAILVADILSKKPGGKH